MITALLFSAIQISPATVPADEDEAPDIVVTASLTPTPAAEAPASLTVFDETLIDALGPTLATDVIRLAPGVAVATTGAQGTETVVRIRGAESVHTLIFIDGIAYNDIAAANAGRFDTFTSAGLSRIELIRGPQSALWGSEALGGVVAMSSPDPLGVFRAEGMVEGGSRDFWRADAALATGGETAGLSATANWTRSDGIDILGGGTGDRDGFETVTLSLKGVARLGAVELGAVGRYIHHDVEFDGNDPLTFARADTLNASTAETYALRGWIGFNGAAENGFSGRLEAQYLDSENRNRDGIARTNDSFGQRVRIGGQFGYRFGTGVIRHHLIGAIERETEDYSTRDLQFGGGTDRDLSRARTAFVAEWRGNWNDVVITDLAVRHDDFNRFADETTVRANALVNLGGGFALLAGYGEGVAQPSFVDLYGFSPTSGYVGNPDLTVERSKGFEGGLRWRGMQVSIEAVAFSNNLEDEIVEDFGSIFPNYTVVNAPGKSRRRGFELSGEWRPNDAVTLGANYTYLDTRENSVVGAAALREVRRPRHTANLYGDWRSGPLTVGGAIAYVGSRTDQDFDLPGFPIVSLDGYALASLRVAYRILPQLELFARAENAFDEDYQDVVGYAAPGGSVYAGLRVALGR